MECPIKLDPIHCQNCYFSRDGECKYEDIVKEEGSKDATAKRGSESH